VSTLEDQLKSTLSQIASTREELLSLPTSAPTTGPARDIPLDELLSYARRIARFTLPPDYRPPPPAKAVIKTSTETEADPDTITKHADIAAATEQANGTTSTPDLSNPPPPPPTTTLSQQPTTASPPSQQPPPSTPDHGTALQNLDPDRLTWLQSVSTSAFVPWPNESTIRSGALADIQAMLERKTDPASILTPEQVAAEAEKRREEELGRQREEEERLRRRAEAVAKVRREAAAEREAEGVGMGMPQQEEFGGLDLYDPDEEEE